MVWYSIFLGGLRLRERMGLLAEIASDFFARGVTEKGHGGDVSFSVVTVDNVAVVLQNRALDAPKLGVEVEATALEDIQLVFSIGIHYVPENRGAAPCRKLFFDFLMRLETPSPISKKTPPRFPGQRRGVVFSPHSPIFNHLKLPLSLLYVYPYIYPPPTRIYKKQ